MTTTALAARFGVTARTVGNYVRDGMPVLREEHIGKGKRKRFFDAAVCERWRAANIAGADHGGRREGAGRPRGRKTDRGGLPVAPGSGDGGGDVGDTGDGDIAALLAEGDAELEKHGITGKDIRLLELSPEETARLPAYLVKRLETVEKTLRMRVEREKLEGRLVDRDEVVAVYSRLMTDHVEGVERACKAVAKRACGLLAEMIERRLAAQRETDKPVAAAVTAREANAVEGVLLEELRATFGRLHGGAMGGPDLDGGSGGRAGGGS